MVFIVTMCHSCMIMRVPSRLLISPFNTTRQTHRDPPPLHLGPRQPRWY
jgi:hypothetical protein